MSTERELLTRLIEANATCAAGAYSHPAMQTLVETLQPLCQSASELLAEPHWSDTLPTEPGWYWVEHPDGDIRPRYLEPIQCEDGVFMLDQSNGGEIFGRYGSRRCRFQGPIKPRE